ncbi:hypothetical protein CXB51_024695 [Gossypium anomalum]|uniref:Uncharacterized protein n=1 Tax=Gossypium anomalum TaxID=47600 RepID=A0A8J5YBA6_9ROSI|nr:hypothetical protein CXB51_024695 [Gossypium anomalum]
MVSVPTGLLTVPFLENFNKFQNPFRRPVATTVFLIGTAVALWLGIGATLPIDKSLTLGNLDPFSQTKKKMKIMINQTKKKSRKKKQYKSNTEVELDFFLKRYLRFQLRWDDSLNQRIINNIKVYCLLLRLINPNEIVISSIQWGEMNLDILMIQKDLTLRELMKKGILIIDQRKNKTVLG